MVWLRAPLPLAAGQVAPLALQVQLIEATPAGCGSLTTVPLAATSPLLRRLRV